MCRALPPRSPENIDAEIAEVEKRLKEARRIRSLFRPVLPLDPHGPAAQKGYDPSSRKRMVGFAIDIAKAEAELADLKRERLEMDLAALNSVDEDQAQAQIDAAWAEHGRLKKELDSARGHAWRLGTQKQERVMRRGECFRAIQDFTAAADAARKEIAGYEAELANLGRWRPAPAVA